MSISELRAEADLAESRAAIAAENAHAAARRATALQQVADIKKARVRAALADLRKSIVGPPTPQVAPEQPDTGCNHLLSAYPFCPLCGEELEAPHEGCFNHIAYDPACRRCRQKRADADNPVGDLRMLRGAR